MNKNLSKMTISLWDLIEDQSFVKDLKYDTLA